MVAPFSNTAVPSDNGQHAEHRTSAERILQAVLWDMDGTIVDTEPYWIEAERALVAAHGGSWSDEQATGLVGQALTFSAGVLQAAGVRLSVREIIDTLTTQVTARVSESVPWRPGARELLTALRQAGIPCALVTMSEQQLALEVSRHLPEGTFELLVTGDQVARGKPDPEAYQRAFDFLSEGRMLHKERVVAIEDSLPGVTSARAAGLVTLGVPHFVALPAESADQQWTSLAGRTVEDVEDLVHFHAGRATGERATA
ncbi:HAD family hydrolase [Arthrobacter sp. Soil782]|uniref:HAD family hydrolase n=1 Tax=Arthrobacter sp. Soil782 TaxID=1736410 RepID=UPI0009EBE0F1|nr:HAD family phosphatase [Arthrobacter sp. Soil782]